MADNNTNVNDPKTFADLVGSTVLIIIAWVLFALTLAAFIYGVTSWCIIKKFRHFRNYVLLSAITANMLRFLVFELSLALVSEDTVIQYPVISVVPISLFQYCSLSYQCWLLVLGYIFYVDFVKVFGIDIDRKYLKSTLFAWGAPFILAFIYFVLPLFLYVYESKEIISIKVFAILSITMILIPVTINFVIYVTVVYSLFRSSEAGAKTSTGKWRRLYIATLIFVLSNIVVLTAFLHILETPILSVDVIGELGEYLNTIAIAIYIIIVKNNRTLWREFVNKMWKQKAELDRKVTNSSHLNSSEDCKTG